MSASASGSKFEGIVSIEGDEAPPVQLFQGADFRSRVAFSGFSDRAKRESFENELAARPRAAREQFDPRKHAEDVESGCRTLRKIAEAAGDVQSEHLWHRAELMSRRARGESAFAESGFSYAYGWIADYGLSISRPFLALGLLTVICGLFYGWIGGPHWMGAVDWTSIEEGLGYSLSRTLPIGVFADEGNSWRKELIGSAGEIRTILIRFFATAQTIAAAILIYLGVMAVRRKFRIS